jgi:hypothetical protein
MFCGGSYVLNSDDFSCDAQAKAHLPCTVHSGQWESGPSHYEVVTCHRQYWCFVHVILRPAKMGATIADRWPTCQRRWTVVLPVQNCRCCYWIVAESAIVHGIAAPVCCSFGPCLSSVMGGLDVAAAACDHVACCPAGGAPPVASWRLYCRR